MAVNSLDMKISKGLVDEVFVLRDLHVMIQIAPLIDALNKLSDVDPLWYPTDHLRSMNRADRIVTTVVACMTDARRDEPVLIACLPDTWVIDGNHRLAKRQLDGFGETQAIVVPPTILVPFIAELGF